MYMFSDIEIVIPENDDQNNWINSLNYRIVIDPW